MVAIVSPAIDRLSRKYPHMFFHVVAGDTAALYRDMTERNIELAICRMIGRLPDELAAEILFHDSFAVMTAAKNPLTRRRKLTLAELVNEPWTLYPFGSFFGSLIAEAFRLFFLRLFFLRFRSCGCRFSQSSITSAALRRKTGLCS